MAIAEVASPLGIEIGKATLDEIKSKYSIIKKEKTIYANGISYYLSPKNLPLDNIKQSFVLIDSNNISQLLNFAVDKSAFESFYESLSQKYKLISKDTPFVGDKLARFQADNAIIILYAPHMSMDLQVTYVTKEYYTLILKTDDKIEQSNKSKQKGAL